MFGTFTNSSHMGLRGYQEDTFVTASMEQGTLLAVFDGHGGGACSMLCSKRLVSTFMHAIEIEAAKAALSERPTDWKEVLRLTCAALDALTNDMPYGSTASIVFILKDESAAFIAVLGDSPVVARMTGGSIYVGPDHNVRSNENEKRAAEKRGGHYGGGYIWNNEFGSRARGLQMGRAFGDSNMGKIVTKEPEICQIPLGSWLLVGSDGLFDPGHANTGAAIQTLAQIIDEGATARQLVNCALAVPTGDNVTAILWRYSKWEKPSKSKSKKGRTKSPKSQQS